MKANNYPSRPAIIPSRGDIERLAFDLWQRKGCPVGRSLEFWLEAERAFASRTQRPANPRRRRPNPEEDQIEPQLNALFSRLGAHSDLRSPTSL